MVSSIKPVFPPAPEPRFTPRSGLQALVKDSFTLPTLLVIGSLAQTILSLLLPSHYAFLPLAFFLGRAVVLTILQLAQPAAYASKQGTIPGRTAAHLPHTTYNPQNPKTPSPFPANPAEKGVVILHLGARYNHPLGLLSPGGRAFTQHFLACHEDVLKQAKTYGCLGGNVWRAADTGSLNTVLSVYYFRDMDGLNRFARDPLHMKAWNWYHGQFVKKWGYSHIGIYHEAFWANPGAYETIYINMPPVLMGAGEAVVRDEEGDREEWVKTVVDASAPVWRSQHSRMGREVKQAEAAQAAVEY